MTAPHDRQSYLFLVGAPKCGTTSVASWLGGARDVCVSFVKEPVYFTDFSKRSWHGPGVEHFGHGWTSNEADYDRLFEDRTARWRLDASTDYLQNRVAFERICDLASRTPVKVVAITRDPVDRAVSQYKHTQREGYSRETLGEALEKEGERIGSGMHPLFWHVERSLYFEAVARYRERLGDDFLVLDYHDIENEKNRIPALIGVEMETGELDRKNSSEDLFDPRVRRVIRSSAVRSAQRAWLPDRFRRPLKNMLKISGKDVYKVSREDLEILRSRLRDEVERCVRCPLIPTGRWNLDGYGF